MEVVVLILTFGWRLIVALGAGITLGCVIGGFLAFLSMALAHAAGLVFRNERVTAVIAGTGVAGSGIVGVGVFLAVLFYGIAHPL